MCLILLAHEVHPGYPLVFGANRDEFHGRPTSPAAFWEEAPEVLAGRDLRAGGTWFGVTRSGRWAALTNFRTAGGESTGRRSRGELVAEFLTGGMGVRRYLGEVAARADDYAGFNLLAGEAGRVGYLGHGAGAPRELEPGVYGLSNHVLDTGWPKVEQGKRALRRLLEPGGAIAADAVLAMLAGTDPAPDARLPDTGVGVEWERVLSATFIVSAEYGTRASTALLVDRAGEAHFVERSFAPGPRLTGEVRERFTIGQEPGR